MQFYAEDIMSDKLIYARPEMSCEEVMDMLVMHHITGMPVLDSQGGLIGVISFYDIISSNLNLTYPSGLMDERQIDRALSREGFHVENISSGFVSDFMSRHVVTALPKTPVEVLAFLMYENKIHRIVIMAENANHPAGIVSTFDLLKLMASNPAELIPSESPPTYSSKPR